MNTKKAFYITPSNEKLLKEFESIVEYIREHGVKEKFEGKEYIYLHLGDFKYWTMGEAVKDTILINRAKI